MGVFGLWQLLDSTGKPVPLESLQGQVLAVDVSIWMHQANHGIAGRNGHIQLLFSRACKLLFHGIRPVFVFDGPTPAIKRECMEKRRRRRAQAMANCSDLRNAVLTNYLKTHILESTSASNAAKDLLPKSKRLPAVLTNVSTFDELFQLNNSLSEERNLPNVEADPNEGVEVIEEYYDENEELENVDVHSEEFRALPFEVQHELLMDIRELKKRRCLLKPVTMPEKLNDFSDFQLKNFLDRSSVTQKIEDVRKDMNRDGLGILGLANIDGAIMRKIASEDSSYMVNVKSLPKSKRADMDSIDSNECSQNSQFFSSETLNSNAQTGISISQVEKALENEFQSKPITITEVDEIKNSSTFSQLQSSMAKETEDKKNGHENSEKPTGFNLQEVLSRLKKPIEVKDKSEDRNSQNILTTVSPDCSVIRSSNSSTVKDEIELLDHSDDEQFSVQTQTALELEESKRSPKSDVKSDNCSQVTEATVPHICDSGVSTQSDSSQHSQELSVINLSSERASTEPRTSQKVDDVTNSSSDDEFEDVELNVVETRDVADFEKAKEREIEIVSTSNRLDKHNLSSSNKPSEVLQEVPNEQLPSTSFVLPNAQSVHFDDNTLVSNFTSEELDNHQTTDSSIFSAPGNSGQNATKTVIKPWNSDESASTLELEEQQLLRELEREETRATTVTEIMYDQCQKLLKLFGLPYIVSPGEAEAQCAFLDSVGLVNGSITDDSDVWLFGGKTVYKNFFEREKFVEKFTMAEIEGKLMVNRSNLICLAMMLGSDYCDGIENVGPVHGMEVLEEFGREFGVEPLEKFKKWHTTVTNQIVPQVTNNVRKRLLKFELPEAFPSQTVFNAYFAPRVDESREKFKWGRPDVFGLKEFMSEFLGWPAKKLDEILQPVLEKQKNLVTQMSLDQFFSVRLGTAKRAVTSKRINEAISKMKTQKSLDNDLLKTKGKVKKKSSATSKSDDLNKIQNAFASNEVSNNSTILGQTNSEKSDIPDNKETISNDCSRMTRKRTKRNDKVETQTFKTQKELSESSSSYLKQKGKSKAKSAKSKSKSKKIEKKNSSEEIGERKRKVNLSESSTETD